MTEFSYWCCPNSLMSSVQVSNSVGTGTTMSSSRAVAPGLRCPATVVYKPLRMCHSRARVGPWLVAWVGLVNGSEASSGATASILPSTPSAVAS